MMSLKTEAYSTLIEQYGVANITMQLDHKNQSTGWWDPCYTFLLLPLQVCWDKASSH